MNIFIKKDSGFTLIEFVVYTALFMLIVLFLFNFLLGALNSQSSGKAREAVINNSVIAINTIDSEIRHAASIYEPTSDFVSNPGQLSLHTRKDSVSGEDYGFSDIFINSDQRLCIKREGSGIECITSSEVIVTSLDFDRIELSDGSDSGARTFITVEYNTPDPERRQAFSLESFVNLRDL